jgi:hypothetical protein
VELVRKLHEFREHFPPLSLADLVERFFFVVNQ